MAGLEKGWRAQLEANVVSEVGCGESGGGEGGGSEGYGRVWRRMEEEVAPAQASEDPGHQRLT